MAKTNEVQVTKTFKIGSTCSVHNNARALVLKKSNSDYTEENKNQELFSL
jgi:hypothetical protein